ncbi:MAG: L-threonylcarbamoyladenylate synthase [Pseudomonadota bacterium]
MNPALILTPTPEALDRAARALTAGKLVAFPTETVYGVGVDASNQEATDRLYTLKGRPRDNPLIVHVASLSMAREVALFNDAARTLAYQFWPGPLTMILPLAKGSFDVRPACAGMDTVAIRLPGHPLAQDLIMRAGVPIAAPSANLSGRLSATTPQAVVQDLAVDLVLADGASPIGLESTILDPQAWPPRLLRPGSIGPGVLAEVLGVPPVIVENAQAPGHFGRHYAPQTPLRLDVREPKPREALLTFGPSLADGNHVRHLSASGDLAQAAANLYRLLRELDGLGRKRIAIMPIPHEGIGLAINDRLARAAKSTDKREGKGKDEGQ